MSQQSWTENNAFAAVTADNCVSPPTICADPASPGQQLVAMLTSSTIKVDMQMDGWEHGWWEHIAAAVAAAAADQSAGHHIICLDLHQQQSNVFGC